MRVFLSCFGDEALNFGAATRRALESAGDLVSRAASTERFKGKSGTTLDILATGGLGVSRLVVVGIGKAADLKSQDLVKFWRNSDGQVARRDDSGHDHC